MIRFTAAFSLAWAAMLVWAWLDRADGLWQSAVAPLILAKLLGAPLVASWFTLDALQCLRPRRAFDPRVRSWTPCLAGLAAGLLSVTLAAAAFALPASGLVDTGGLDTDWLDLGVVAAACTVGTLASSAPLRSACRGACVHCGYDLTGAPTATCPECGRVGGAG